MAQQKLKKVSFSLLLSLFVPLVFLQVLSEALWFGLNNTKKDNKPENTIFTLIKYKKFNHKSLFYSFVEPERAKNTISFIKSTTTPIPTPTIIIIRTVIVMDGAATLKPSKGISEKLNGNN